MEIGLVLLLPLLGTALGSAGVYFPGIGKKGGFLTGFAGGVMVAASLWSLILPALEQCAKELCLPLLGIWAGWLFVPVLNRILHCLCRKKPSQNTILAFAVAMHNFPEGMVVGVAAAAWLTSRNVMSYGALMALSIGIALQNIPEGAILSMPLHTQGTKKGKAFLLGVFSGAVEPVAGILAIAMWHIVVPILPFCLCFAAGTMLCVVVDTLFSQEESGANWSFLFGFTVMMTLDVLLG